MNYRDTLTASERADLDLWEAARRTLSKQIRRLKRNAMDRASRAEKALAKGDDRAHTPVIEVTGD